MKFYSSTGLGISNCTVYSSVLITSFALVRKIDL